MNAWELNSCPYVQPTRRTQGKQLSVAGCQNEKQNNSNGLTTDNQPARQRFAAGDAGGQPTTLVLFFLPQLLQWLGFLLLPLPFIYAYALLRKK